MLININMMKGMMPRLKPHLLANEAATLANDCQFERGVVSPINSDLAAFSLPDSALSIFKYGENWLYWDISVNAIDNPMAQDEYSRVYWTGQGKPKVSAQDIILSADGFGPNAWYDLGVPSPSAAPVVSDIDTSTGEDPEEGELDSYDDEDRVYIQTYVTRFGEEGAPGDPSESVVVEKPGSTVTITLSQPGENTHNITHTRLYRSVTTSTSSDYILVAEIPIAQLTYVDSERDASGATLETYDYNLPDENMEGLCQMANGICAGFAGNEVMFSEAFLPYAWPEGYRDSIPHEIVAIAAIGTSLVVGTKGFPYLYSGVTPSAMTGNKLSVKQSCVSAKSMVELDGLVLYASPDGLIAVSSDGATNATNKLMTRKQWQSLAPETIEAVAVEGKYVAKCDGGAFVFDPVAQDFVDTHDDWDCTFSDLEDDELYLCKDGAVSIWRKGNEVKEYIWQSKAFLMPFNSTLTSARISAEAPEELKVTFIADDTEVLVLEKGEVTDEPFRLPSARANKWKVKLEGTTEVDQVLIADSMEELA